ncbi:MAG: hypothetical protein EXR89_02930 [Methylococcaceae bacterium]|nr:hypothetical protein [Methylococcaceae bacterium]
MTDNKNLPKITVNSGLALHKTRNLLSITDKILSSKRLAVVDDAWLDELIAWANFFKISKKRLPRNKQEILKMTRLNLARMRKKLTYLPESLGKLTNLTVLDLTYNPIKSLPPELSHLLNSINKFD